MRAHRPVRCGLVALGVLLAAPPSWSQVTPGGTPPGAVGRPGAVESAPLAPPPGTAVPAPAPGAATPAPAAPAPATPASPAPGAAAQAPAPGAVQAPATRITTAGRPTLVPNAGDPVNVDEVTLPGKPAAVLAGIGTWDQGFVTLQNAFRKIEDELTRAGMTPAGKPLTVFLETDDLGFRYEAMVPIAQAPAGRPSLTPEVRLGRTPQGKALRFVHKGAYEEIDEMYETITAYLDAKGVAVQDNFIEEYVADLTEAADPNLEINIFVQPK